MLCVGGGQRACRVCYGGAVMPGGGVDLWEARVCGIRRSWFQKQKWLHRCSKRTWSTCVCNGIVACTISTGGETSDKKGGVKRGGDCVGAAGMCSGRRGGLSLVHAAAATCRLRVLLLVLLLLSLGVMLMPLPGSS